MSATSLPDPDVDRPAPRIVPGSGTRLSTEQLADLLRARLGDGVIDVVDRFGQLVVEVAPESWVDAVRLVKEDEAVACNYWEFLDAVDRREEGYEVVVNVYSVEHQHRVVLKTLAPGGREKPKLPSIAHLYRGANWSERETYDMFGIDFEGHPGLEPRILTIENFEGWPLRKDFLLTTREAKPWPGSKEPEERPAEGEGGADAGGAPAQSAEEKAAAAKAKAERAKAKAAAMRAKKAAEKAEAQRQEAGEAEATLEQQQAAGAASDQQAQAEAADAQRTTRAEAATAKAAADADEHGRAARDEQADAAEREKAVKEDEGAGVVGAAAGDPEPQTPEGAAEIAQSGIAKDAAAGAVQGDVAAGAPGDQPGSDQPVHDPEAEATAAEGARGTASGTPGVEAEGRHGGAEVQGGDVPPEQTPGLTSDPQPTAARPAEQYPVADPGDQRGAVEEAPESQAREATAGDREVGEVEDEVTTTPLAEEGGVGIEPREAGTDASRVRRSGEDDPEGTGENDPTRAEGDQA